MHWLGHCCPAEQLLSSMAAPAETHTSSQLSGNQRGPKASGGYSTVIAAEVRRGHVLQGDLSQEGRALAARIPRYNATAAKPRAQPRETTVTVEGVGQQVPEGGRRKRERGG